MEEPDQLVRFDMTQAIAPTTRQSGVGGGDGCGGWRCPWWLSFKRYEGGLAPPEASAGGGWWWCWRLAVVVHAGVLGHGAWGMENGE